MFLYFTSYSAAHAHTYTHTHTHTYTHTFLSIDYIPVCLALASTVAGLEHPAIRHALPLPATQPLSCSNICTCHACTTTHSQVPARCTLHSLFQQHSHSAAHIFVYMSCLSFMTHPQVLTQCILHSLIQQHSHSAAHISVHVMPVMHDTLSCSYICTCHACHS